jgi:hypothetical protein
MITPSLLDKGGEELLVRVSGVEKKRVEKKRGDNDQKSPYSYG